MARLNTKIALRSDTTAGWASADTAAKDAGGQGVVLLKGEVGVEFTTNGTPKMKIGDGITAWSDLEYVGGAQANVFEVIPELKVDGETKETHIEAITRVVGSKSLNAGDIAYVKELIHSDKYSYTGYVYNGTAWAAMDGNYSAENIYFDSDMMVTKSIGYITVDATIGRGTIPAAGKNLVEVFESMFVEEKQPTKNDPAVVLTTPQNKAYEVGTEVTPTYTVALDPGSYTYGPATGVKAVANSDSTTGWKITATGVEGFKTDISGSYDKFTVTDTTNFTIRAEVTHSAGTTTPLSNKGNVATSITAIEAGTKDTTSAPITGYRKLFMGTTSATDPTIDSDFIRGLAFSDVSKKMSKEITASAGDTMIVWAFPTKLTTARPTFKYDFMSTWYDLDGVQTYKTDLPVEGKDGHTAAPYTVYIYKPAGGTFEATTKTKITIN